jgi:hypothetical protein
MYCRFVFGSAALALVCALTPAQAQTLAFPTFVAPTGSPPPFKMKCVTGKPYSFESKTSISRRLADGTWTTTVLKERKMRDSEGRERTERTNGSGRPPAVSLTDPAAQTIVSLILFNKTAIVMHISLPKPPTPEQEARSAEARANAARYRAVHPSNDTTALPTRTIAGISAEGERRIITLHAATLSNGDPVRVVEETWTSSDLGIPLASTSDDPRGSKITMTVTDLQRTEPDPSLFKIPPDYQITERQN